MNAVDREVEGWLRELEAIEAVAAIQSASSLDGALRGALSLHSVRRLIELASSRPGSTLTVLARLRDVAARPIDPEFESPWDASLVAMLVVVAWSYPIARAFAASTVMGAPQTWWATRAARDLLTYGECWRRVGLPEANPHERSVSRLVGPSTKQDATASGHNRLVSPLHLSNANALLALATRRDVPTDDAVLRVRWGSAA